ncbi:G-protein coupled receptor GRL101-like [Gigantopelta aegis]|uniref:G-protein coupled receptor GRL101-like n=1 Tax=Gigantopelta aegis TaxID=1735272 RepID=UPI001B88D751|nr:G-protein coupled receptor GRL101-like [Gigantopelta aegis]
MALQSGNFSLADALSETIATQITLTSGRRLGGLGVVIVIATTLTKNELYSAGRIAADLRRPCDSTWTYYKGQCYRLYKADEGESSMKYGYSGIHWLNARKKCAELNSDLVSISDAMEENFLLHHVIKIEGDIHIGLKRSDNTLSKHYQGMYRWTDGKPPTYLNWKQISPQVKEPDGAEEQSCVTLTVIDDQTWWEDIGCADPLGKGFICEVKARNVTEQLVHPVVHPPTRAPSIDRLFNCSNGEIIWESRKCDRHPDCSDGSDEQNCGVTSTCGDTQFRCKSNDQCISWDFYCDFIIDCVDKSDETMCVPRPCDDGEWRCSNNQCINSLKVCDLKRDCHDGSDELNCHRCKGFHCTDGACIPYSWQCDGIVDCSGTHREDEDSSLCSLLKSSHLSTNTLCHWKPQGVYDAMPRHLSGLERCDTVTCDEGYYKCPQSYCIPIEFVCNGVMDCVDGADEHVCDEYICPGYFRCRHSFTCINLLDVCDNKLDCPEGDDELSCHFTCPPMCNCSGSVLQCAGQSLGNETFGSLTRKLDLSFSNVDQLTGISFQGLHMLAVLNLSNSRIKNIQWTFWELNNLILLDLSYNNITHLKRKTFSGMINLRLLDLSGNGYLSTIEVGTFDEFEQLAETWLQYTGIRKLNRFVFSTLSNLITLYISYSELRYIGDHTFENLTKLKYLDLYETKITDFGQNIFDGLDNLEILRTGTFLLCCPRVRPPSIEDDKCLAPQDKFSSCDDLMQNNVLRVFIWILGIASVSGNILIIVYRLCIDKTPLNKACGYFILNLGFSDLFMGVYMIFIGTADMLYRGKYLWYSNIWKQSQWCKTAGFLSTLSSEASTMLICLISLDRFLAIKFPFGHVRFSQRSYIGACLLAWLLALVMAMVPLLPATSHWNLYGRNSVCLALPLSRDRAPGWQYATSIFIGFNLLAFTFIAAAQIVIYGAMKSGSIVKDKKRLARERSVARKLTLVVVTDFICWFPVGIMGMNHLFILVVPWKVAIAIVISTKKQQTRVPISKLYHCSK